MSETIVQTPGAVDGDGHTATPEGFGTEEPQDGPHAPDVNKSLAEANARYVRERDTAREALAAALAHIEQMHRAEVERLAGESLAIPGDLFSLSGNELADYLTEDGSIDPEKVTADVAAILAQRPGLKKQPPAGYDPTQGYGGRTPKASEPTFADLFKAAPGNNGAQLIHYG